MVKDTDTSFDLFGQKWPDRRVTVKIPLVDEISAELQNLKNSLVNNNLLHSCTIRGVTNDWYLNFGDARNGVIAVEGIIFKILIIQ